MTVPGAQARFGILPRRLHGQGGASAVAAHDAAQRTEDPDDKTSPIPNSPFCQRLRSAKIAALSGWQIFRAKSPERLWIN